MLFLLTLIKYAKFPRPAGASGAEFGPASRKAGPPSPGSPGTGLFSPFPLPAAAPGDGIYRGKIQSDYFAYRHFYRYGIGFARILHSEEIRLRRGLGFGRGFEPDSGVRPGAHRVDGLRPGRFRHHRRDRHHAHHGTVGRHGP